MNALNSVYKDYGLSVMSSLVFDSYQTLGFTKNIEFCNRFLIKIAEIRTVNTVV